MPLYTFTKPDGTKVDRIVPVGTWKVKLEDGTVAIRKEQEVPAKRNPAYGIQR